MMLIKGLLDLIYSILNTILFIEIPDMPETIIYLLDEVRMYVISGLDVIIIFIGRTAAEVLSLVLGIVIAANLFYLAWSIVFWILRKIPMLGIEE